VQETTKKAVQQALGQCLDMLSNSACGCEMMQNMWLSNGHAIRDALLHGEAQKIISAA
jgi:hypothetical protein